MSGATSGHKRPAMPAHWKLIPFRWCCSIANGQVDPTLERMAALPMIAPNHIESGTGRLLEYETAAEQGAISGKYFYPEGTVIYSKIRPALRKVCIAPSAGLCSADMYPIYSSRLVPKFLLYQLLSERFSLFAVTESDRVAMPKLNRETLGGFVMIVPPLPEQNKIVDFLDQETAKIDALIAKQKEFIQRINENLSAVIYKAMTRGIDSTATFAESGLSWLGDIPAHWAVRPLRYLVRFASGGTPNKETAAFWNGGIPWVSPKDMKRAVITSSEDTVSEAALQATNLSLQPIGSVLIVVRGMILARYVPVAENSVPVTINQDMKAMSVKGGNLPSFIRHYLSNIPNVLATLIEEAGHGTKTLRTELLAAVPVPVPPPEEQNEIVKFIDTESMATDALVARSREFIEYLRERRSALITAAVTGQIVVAPAPALLSEVAANDNRQTLRVVVGAEIVSRHGLAKNFGRVKLQKLLYLAEVHAKIHELAGNYVRKAAGPLAPDLLSETERGMEAAGFYRTEPPVNQGDGYTYSRIGKIGSHRDQFTALLGDRATALTQLIDRLKDYDTRQVEAITTLYAVWNDALLDGETPTDDRIIRGVLEEWHPEKKDKFAVADLKTWLAWIRRNGVVPNGTGSRTQLDRLFV